MASIFQTLEQRVLNFVKSKLKLGSLNANHLKEICKFQRFYLNNIIESLDGFKSNELSLLRDKYIARNRRPSTLDCRKIIMNLRQDLHGKAGLFERDRPFGAAIKTAKEFLKIVDEIDRKATVLVNSQHITIDSAKITDVVMLGILRECDLFTKYTSYLWEYFRIVLTDGADPVPYRARYMLDNLESYVAIMENVCDKQNNYTFLSEIDSIKRKNADLLLYANKSSFLSFLNRNDFSKSQELHITHGIIGFNMLAWVVSYWDDWKHVQYKKTKIHREQLQQEEFRLKQVLMDVDPKSPEAIQTAKYLEAYSAAVTKLDQEITEYEGDSDQS